MPAKLRGGKKKRKADMMDDGAAKKKKTNKMKKEMKGASVDEVEDEDGDDMRDGDESV